LDFTNMSLLDAYIHLKEIRSSQLTDVCTNEAFQRACNEKEMQLGRTSHNTIPGWAGSRNEGGHLKDRACKTKGSEVTDKRSRSTKPFVSTAPVSTKGATPQGAVKLILFV
jgi:hypothetical protein